MQLTSPAVLKQFCNLLQGELFPVLESAVGPLSKTNRLLTSALSLVSVGDFIAPAAPTGRPQCDRQSLATAFLAKAVYNMTTTRQLLDRLGSDTQLRRLCGWDSAAALPAESTFSRAFAEFARTALPTRLHTALIQRTQKGRTVEYLARDSTAIEARETFPEPASKATKSGKPRKPTQAKKGPRKPFGPNRREVKPHRPHRFARQKLADRGTRIERQHHMTLEAMIAELPQQCSLGVKSSRDGNQKYWRGYKLHWDISSHGRIPISCLLTGANVHDSQVAIPLMETSKDRIQWKCELMDSAYDAKAIRKKAKKLKHEVLIKPVDRPNAKKPREWTEQQKQRFKGRTIVEQQNARLKDEFGGRHIYVRSAPKVMAHLMFGVIALTVDQVLRTVG
jgi:hypothetical protein